MDYRESFYKKYVSGHTLSIYGENSLEKIKRKFIVWRKYFGRFLPTDKQGRVLDLGCGNGEFVYWLNKEGFRNVEGVDVSGEQIKIAKELGIENIHQAHADDFLKNKQGVYDLVFARDFLEHFSKEELLGIIEIIHLALKPNGIFVAQTVNAENLFWGRLRHGDFTHDLAFTGQSISQLLKVVGFAEVSVFPQRPVVHGVRSLLRYILWRLFELVFHLYLLIETGSPRGIFTQNIIAIGRKS